MLFDEKDFRVFDNADSRNYFKEILQSYYSQNYRATIVLLYSFVIYDLFIKICIITILSNNLAMQNAHCDNLCYKFCKFLRCLHICLLQNMLMV